MTRNLNQFAQSAEKGILDLALNPNILSCRIKSTSVSEFIAGTALVITDSPSKVINVEKAAAATDDVFGFVVYSAKKSSPKAGDFIEVAFVNSVMVMEASAAVARGADLEIVPTGDKVVTKTTGTSIGRALDQAAADGDLIRVLIKTS